MRIGALGRDQARRLVRAAEELQARGENPLRVLQGIERALRFDPRNAEAFVLKGRILFWSGQVARALSCYGRAISIDPRCADAFLERGRILYAVRRRKTAALGAIRKALALAGKRRWLKVESLRLQGHILSEMDRDSASIASYRAAVELDRGNVDILWSLADALLISGRPREALRYVQRALRGLARKRDPDQVELSSVIYSHASILKALGRHGEALRVVDDGLTRVSEHTQRSGLKGLREEIERAREVQQAYRRRLVLVPRPKG